MPELKLGIKLTVDEIRSLITREELKLPKYAAPIINLANRFAQATRPNVVGKMSELIKECPYRNLEGWKQWYMARYPKAIENATKKIMEMLKRFRKVLDEIDENLVRRWVEDLVLVKSFLGLRVQEPILKYFANQIGEKYRLSNPEEESRGIDGYIGSYSVSIKPITYKEKEKIAGEFPAGDVIIFYEKDMKNNILIIEIKSLSERGLQLIKRIKNYLDLTIISNE